MTEVLKQQGAYKLRFAEGTEAIEWVSGMPGREEVLNVEPDSDFWGRMMLKLLAPLVPESFL